MLTLVWGHRGAGKTTAVVDWVRNGPLSDIADVLWLDGESRAWGRGEFRAWLVRALRDNRPDADRQRLAPSFGGDPSFGPFVRRAAAAGRPIVLVIDGARRLQADLLEDLLDLSSSAGTLRVVVVLEDQVGAEPRRMLRSAHVASIGPAELAFTPDEVEDIFGGAGAVPPGGYGGALYGLTSGDPMVTMALVRELERMEAPVAPSGLRLQIVRDVVGVPAIESIAEAPALLRRLGLAHRPTLQLAEKIAGGIDAAGILSKVEAAGVGAWSPIDAEPRFHVPPPAARILADEVPLPAEDCRHVLHLVREWAATSQDFVNTVGSSLDLGEEDSVGSLIAEEAGMFVALSQPSLQYLLERGAGGPEHPSPSKSFLAAVAYARHVGLRMTAAPILASDRGQAPSDGGAAGMVVTVYAAAVAHRAAVDVAAAVDAAPLAGDPWGAAAGPSLLAGVLTEHALVLAASGEDEEALAELGRAIEPTRPATPLAVFPARVLRAALEARAGRMDAARALVRDVGRSGRIPGWRSDAVDVPFRVVEAWLAMEEFEVEDALLHLRHAAALADTVEFWTLVAEPLGRVSYLSEEGAGAWEWLDRRELPAGATRTWRLQHARAWALRDLSRSDYERGLSRFDGMDSLPEAALERARLHLYAGDFAVAGQLAAVAGAQGLPSPRLRSDHAAISAAIDLRTRANVGIRDALDMITDLARRGLPSFPLALLPARERDVLRTLSRPVPGHPGRADGGVSADRVRLVAGLSVTDLEILKLLAQGHKLIQVAKIRVVSINTIKSRVRILYRRLGVAGRGEAVEVAERLGLLAEVEDEGDGAAGSSPGPEAQFPATGG